MSHNGSKADFDLMRRETISRLRLRGLSFREIVVALEKQTEIRNPKTGLPYSIFTVHADMKRVEEQWRLHMMQSISEHKKRILAELAELKRAGWTDKDYATVIKALAKECEVIGVNAPIKTSGRVEHDHKLIDQADGGNGKNGDPRDAETWAAGVLAILVECGAIETATQGNGEAQADPVGETDTYH